MVSARLLRSGRPCRKVTTSAPWQTTNFTPRQWKTPPGAKQRESPGFTKDIKSQRSLRPRFLQPIPLHSCFRLDGNGRDLKCSWICHSTHSKRSETCDLGGHILTQRSPAKHVALYSRFILLLVRPYFCGGRNAVSRYRGLPIRS